MGSASVTGTRRRTTPVTRCATSGASSRPFATRSSTTGAEAARSSSGTCPTGPLLLRRGERPIDAEGPSNGGPLAGDDEVDQRDVDHGELDPSHVEAGPRGGGHPRPGKRPVELEERGDGQDHKPVGSGQKTGVKPPLSERLGLGPHVAHQEEGDEGEERVRVGGNGEPEEDGDIGVPVVDVVDEISPDGGTGGLPGDLSVQHVEQSREKDESGDREEEVRRGPADEERGPPRGDRAEEGQETQVPRAPPEERPSEPCDVGLDLGAVRFEDHPRLPTLPYSKRCSVTAGSASQSTRP